MRHAVHDVLATTLVGRGPGVMLSGAGRAQAARLAARLRHEAIARIQSSPQPRAWQTAEPIAAAVGLDIEHAEALDEVDFGVWTGLSFAELEADPAWRAWNDDRDHAAAPAGETAAAARDRIIRHLFAVAESAPEVTSVLVSHAEIIRSAVLVALGLPLAAWPRVEVSPASITELAVGDGALRLVSLNERPAA